MVYESVNNKSIAFSHILHDLHGFDHNLDSTLSSKVWIYTMPIWAPQMNPVDGSLKPTLFHKLAPKIKKTTPGQTLLSLEETLRNRWLIKGMIGHGGYGEIYCAIDIRNSDAVAIKVEPKKRKGRVVKRMILEQKVLLRLQGRPHVPKMIASGNDNKINFIVMQLLSVNIGDLKKQSPVKRLGRSSVGRILQQAIAGLRDIHLCGYIHRDVKPANMCFGISPQTRHILVIVDFGLVRRYKNIDGTTRPLRPKAGFRGTVRYVSIRVHDRIDQGPADDLVSLVYSGLELLIGDLPWKYIVKGEEVKRAKQELVVLVQLFLRKTS
uniref:non-specific serine/threonine protein kinase n=1 Tax=Angiostrongylus cantonensis TaxID=6313 RepID=A0A0K0CSY4_ANGCA